MYRSDKQFMKNPATASSRIYIGNLMEQVTAGDLEDRFKCYGKILGLVLQRGFGFIQFEADVHAQNAIKSEHNAYFFGKKLNVKQALDKTRPMNSQNLTGSQQPNTHQLPQRVSLTNVRMESPPPPPTTQQAPPQNAPKPLMETVILPPKLDEPEKMDVVKDDVNDKKEKDEPMRQSRPSDVGSDPSDIKRSASGNRQGQGPMNQNRREREHDRFANEDFPMRDVPIRDVGLRDIPSRDLRDLPSRDMREIRDVPYYGREDSFRGPAFIPPTLMDRPERNDCEIIVVSRLLTEYAEYIERRLKDIGLMVDLLYPNEDVPIGRVLANISSRGCLYAILVMPQNEEFHSLTLSILHGIPQEHRNMPIEDAITLITRNFDSYMRGEKSALPGTGTNLMDRHPENIQMVFNLLAENRQITSNQYDRILKYLQDRKELQKQFEVGEGGGENDSELQPHTKQAELQSRIMNILNKSADDLPKPVEPPQPPTGSTPLLNDPTVQKALDSLLSGDMFKSIASGL